MVQLYHHLFLLAIVLILFSFCILHSVFIVHGETATVYKKAININEEKTIKYGYYYEISSSNIIKSGSRIKGEIIADRPVRVKVFINSNEIYDSGYKAHVILNLVTDYDGILYIRIYNDKPDLEDSGSINVPPGQTIEKKFLIDKGEKVEFYASITGGSGDDADINIYDPEGYLIIGGRYSNSFSYKFTTEETGYYTILFGNTFSIISSKTINYSIRATAPRDVKISFSVEEPFTYEEAGRTTPLSPTSNEIPIILAILLASIGIIIAIVLVTYYSMRKGKT